MPFQYQDQDELNLRKTPCQYQLRFGSAGVCTQTPERQTQAREFRGLSVQTPATIPTPPREFSYTPR
jgi:hypothetical protein